MNLILNSRISIVLLVCLTWQESYGYSSFKSSDIQDADDEQVKQANKQVECGVSSGHKININGTEITAYPWFVLLEYASWHTWRQIRCAGVIIDDFHVLTSASCANQGLMAMRYSQLSPSCSSENDLASCVNPSKIADVSEHHIFSSSDSSNNQDNIGILRLSKRLEFDEFVKPICLNTRDTGFDNSKQFFCPQWKLKQNRVSSEPLIKRSPVEVCNEAYDSGSSSFEQKLICVSPGSVLPGGPLVHVQFGENDSRKSFVVGVVNAEYMSCGSDDMLGTYTKVSSYSDWIQEKIQLKI